MMLIVANTPNGSQNPTQSGPGQGSPGANDASAASQAQRIDMLLIDSITGRKHLLTAIDEALACDKVNAIAEIRTAINARWTVLTQAREADFSALPDGDHLKSTLVTFLSDSYRADQAYLNWVESADGNCPSTSASAFNAVQSANNQAHQDKIVFLAGWNPIAKQFNLPARSAKSI